MIHLYIATEEGKIYDARAKLVTLPSAAGVITILQGHENLIATIDAGEISVQDEHDVRTNYSAFNGVINVVTEGRDTKVSVLLESSEDVELLDLEEAEKSLERAKSANKEKFDDVGLDTNNALLRELNRVKIARRYK